MEVPTRDRLASEKGECIGSHHVIELEKLNDVEFLQTFHIPL